MVPNINISRKAAAFLAIVLTLTGLAACFEYKYTDRFYPGVYLDGKYVGGKTREAVIGEYKKNADDLYKNGITLIFESENGERKVNIPMTASGMSPYGVVEYFSLGDWEGALNGAYGYGRNGSLLNNIKEQGLSLAKNKIFNFPVVFQNAAIESFYSRELKDYFKKAAPAEFIYSAKKLSIRKETAGEEVAFSEIIKEIDRKLSSFDPTPIRLKTKTILPSTTKEKLNPFLSIAQEISHGINLYFKYKDYGWKVNGDKLVTWLKLDENNRLALDSSKLEAFLYKNIIPVLENRPQSSRFAMKDGTLIETAPGKPGNMVDIENTVAKTEEIIFGRKHSLGLADSMLASLGDLSATGSNLVFKDGYIIVPIDIAVAPPRVTMDTLLQYEIKELIGTATTNFKGSSADRIHNIRVGVSKLTGNLIAPGEEFSTVFSLGTTTEEEGFVKEFVIKEDKSVKELGGGLCQVATTMFRLALDAGLPIKERTNHRYVVSYYGPGLDATIYGPHPDLRFVNDTGHYLLLQGTVTDKELKFEFFGQKDGRQANISEPILTDEKPAPPTKYVMSNDVPYATQQCSETPHKGVTADVTYNITYKDGKINEQKFKSIYQPWQKICLIGLGTTTPIIK